MASAEQRALERMATDLAAVYGVVTTLATGLQTIGAQVQVLAQQQGVDTSAIETTLADLESKMSATQAPAAAPATDPAPAAAADPAPAAAADPAPATDPAPAS